MAHRVTDARLLDLDNVSSKIRQKGRGQRTSDHRPGVDHPKAFQRSG
jgi:hypothetical protein